MIIEKILYFLEILVEVLILVVVEIFGNLAMVVVVDVIHLILLVVLSLVVVEILENLVVVLILVVVMVPNASLRKQLIKQKVLIIFCSFRNF
jgi:hypothetical protein